MENNNSVCYVARINEIKPIEGADNIEQAVVGGWNCIIQKDQYTEGSLVIIATTDAVIPIELSDAMNVTNYLRKGQRVKTVKLRGVYSECLIIPIGTAAKATGFANTKFDEGDDMMDTLKIYKYEPPVREVTLAKGRKIRYQDNPNFHIYYKFPNLKNVPGMYTEEDIVEIARKIHGTNARYGIVKKSKLSIWDRIKKFFTNDPWIAYEYVYGSHNVEKGSDSQGYYGTDVWKDMADKLDIKNKLWKYVKDSGVNWIGEGFILYGEIYGPGIQANYDYKLSQHEFAGFDVKVNGQYTGTYRAWAIISEHLELNYVPVLYFGPWSQKVQDSCTFNNFIEGTKIPHEGIVIKPSSGDRHKVAKVINPDYLIYGEKNNVGDSH
jgi:RNA ligase (TIGR02306 family)